MKEIIKRTWTGSWIEPKQEAAWHTPVLTFHEMVEAEKSGVPSEQNLRPAKHIRGKLNLVKENGDLPVQAVAYASAHGVYDLYINGTKADGRYLAPETTNYNKLIWYQSYDITELIAESSYAYIDVLLGDGWYIGRLGMGGASCNYGDRLAYIMDIELTYPDGSIVTVGSDESFISCDSFIKYSDLYIGEMQDGTAFDYIELPKYKKKFIATNDLEERGDIPKWEFCQVTDAPTDLLIEQPQSPVELLKEIPMCAYVETANGDLVADFGEVVAGTVRIVVDAEPGTEITIEHAEVLDKEGNYYCNIKGLYKDQKDRYICRGGEQAFAPHFTYHGFRYIRITGIEKDQIKELTALVYGTPLEKIASFETDNALINGLQAAIENSTIGNMFSVPTDCPQREKLGWTGDISIFTPTGAFLYDLRGFLDSWLYQLRIEQGEDGEVPIVIPNHPSQEATQRGMSGGTNSSAAWSDCCIFIPLNLYRIYGDIHFLWDNFDAMEKWMAYVKAQAVDNLWIHRFHFGDWLIPSYRELPDGVMRGVGATADITGSCYYSLMAGAMADICRILANDSVQKPAGIQSEELLKKADAYQKLQQEINRALVSAYVSKDGQVGQEPLMGLYVILLKTGAITDPLLEEKVVKRLVSLVEEQGYSLDCGFSSIGFLLDVLYDHGYQDAAWKMLFCEKAPSWLYMIKNGATTIWENWRAILEDGTVTDSSYNHYAYGCVGDFMYRHIAGIQGMEPGYRTVRIAPDFGCGLKESKCRRKLEQGSLRCDWKLEDAKGSLELEVPEGVRAVIEIPGLEKEVTAGSYHFDFSL